MPATPISEMTEFALEELLSSSGQRRRALVRQLCTRWPAVPALSVVFAITSAASLVEDNFDRSADSDRIGAFAYKLAALLAADVFAVESIGHQPAKARDLLHFWRRFDDYFLDL